MPKDVFSAEFIADCDVTKPRSVAQIYGALWRRRVAIGSMTSPMIVSELGLTENDYQWLRRWVKRFPEDYYECYLIQQTLATFRLFETDLPVSRAIGLILAVTFAEHLRRAGLDENNASAWPVLRNLFAPEAERVLFVQRQPCDGLKQAVKNGLTRTGFEFLHRFDEEKTQQWFSTLTAQYGLSKPEIAEIRSLLVQPSRAALEFLIARLPAFGAFWEKLKEIRAGLVSSANAREYLKASPFIPIGCAEELLANLCGPRARAEGGGLAVGATQDASGLIARWKLGWTQAGPSVRIALDAERIAAALPGDDEVSMTMNGRFWAKLWRDGESVGAIAERTLGTDEIKPTLSFRFESGGAAREESIALVPDAEDVMFFDAGSGRPAPNLQSLDPARAWICFCRSDLTLSCPALKFSTSEGWASHYIEAGEIRGAVLCDANGLEVWSHAVSSAHDTPRPSAPLIRAEPVNAGEYLAVNSRMKLRLRVIGEGALTAVRIAGTSYPVQNTGASAFVDDVHLGANLRSREVPFRYVVQHDDRRLTGNMNIPLPIVGAFIERDGAWLPLFKRDVFAAENADEQKFRFLHSYDGPGVLFNGHRYLQTCADVPSRLGRGLDGLGEDFSLRPQAFNQGHERIDIAYTCVRSGLIAWAEMHGDGQHMDLKLRRPNDLIGCDLVLWSARSGLKIVGHENMISHDKDVSQNFMALLPDGFGPPDVAALSYRGELQGSWCFSENEVWRTPPVVDAETAREWAAIFRWCRLPFNWNVFSGFFGELLRRDPLMIEALFSAEPPSGLRRTPTIHGDDVMERSLRYLIDRSLPEFCEWMRMPAVAQAWAQLYRRLARVHPLLARTAFHMLAGRWPTPQPNWQAFEDSVRPALRARFGDELDKRYLESAIEKWLTGDDPSSAEMTALLCEDAFEKWFWDGWLQS
jgi:hypothetical protein